MNTGLSGDKSDIVGEAELSLSNKFSLKTRVRFDEDDAEFRRIDTSVRYSDKRFSTRWRYYRINNEASTNSALLEIPAEEISGNVKLKLTKNWSTSYTANFDIDASVARRQEFGLIYDDQCTRIELFYNQTRNDIGVVGGSGGFGIRLSLLTLGSFSGDSSIGSSSF